MAAATKHQDAYRSVISTGESYNDTDTTTTMKFDVVPTLSAGEKMILWLEDSWSAPTKREAVRIDGGNITGTTITGVERDIYGTGKQTWTAGNDVSNYASAAELDAKAERTGDKVTVVSAGAEVYNNVASGTFNYNNGEQQKCTLTSAGTVISFTNVPEGGMLTAVISAADTYAPDISGLSPWGKAGAPTFDAVTIIHAVNANGTLRYIAGEEWAS